MLRVKWLKPCLRLASVSRKGSTSLLEKDLADVLKKYGYVDFESPKKEKKVKVHKAVIKETRTR